ncbi:type VII secretion system-associated protein [Streptomyces sp. NPDC019531]|uniref:type VII secretion system-associated protein n=1 Tax=Streptomyces sp. NPDC019531 TaxID=3365062 RepID=UPI00384F7326
MAPKTTVLDSEWLRAFIKEHIEEFRAALDKMLKDDPSGPSMENISNGDITNTTVMSSRPLVLGLMAGSGDIVGGADLNKKVKEAAGQIGEIFKDHHVLFADLEEALWETIKKLKENQKKSLDEISADDFLDIFDDVDSDISGTDSDQTKQQ